MRRRRKREMKSPEIMLSPMIDMIFLLLVFFIVSTMYMSEVKTIPIRLPQARHSENVSKSNFNVSIKADGSLYLDENPIEMDLLVQIIQLMDKMKGAGVTRFGLATDSGAGGYK